MERTADIVVILEHEHARDHGEILAGIRAAAT
jgi:hypothetical protein